MQPRSLIWGKNGWIAGHLNDLLRRQNKDVYASSVRMEDRIGVDQVLDEIKPTHVINCAGKTGRPNVDWCEDHKTETIQSNVIGTLMLAQACWIRSIHLTVMATGCKSAFSDFVGQKAEQVPRHIHFNLQRVSRHAHQPTLH